VVEDVLGGETVPLRQHQEAAIRKRQRSHAAAVRDDFIE
jgi:hypothetical protein